MNQKAKIYINNILAMLNAIGTIVILIILLHLVFKINSQLRIAHSETAKAVARIQDSEREQIKILRCQFEVFGKDRTAPVSLQELDGCLKGTSFEPKSGAMKTVPKATSSNKDVADTSMVGSETRNTIIPIKRQSTDSPIATQPTTSSPPPNPEPQPATNPAPASVVTDLLQPVTSVIDKLSDIVK